MRKILWDRLYLNQLYHKVFVGGISRISSFIYKLEVYLAGGFHYSLGDISIKAGTSFKSFESEYSSRSHDGLVTSLLKTTSSAASFESTYSNRSHVLVEKISLLTSKLTMIILELKVIDKFNYATADAFVKLYHKVKKIQTGLISYNMLYIAIAFILFIIILMLRLHLT
jgi:hypothetical protein